MLHDAVGPPRLPTFHVIVGLPLRGQGRGKSNRQPR
jgi:hypothetical protein